MVTELNNDDIRNPNVKKIPSIKKVESLDSVNDGRGLSDGGKMLPQDVLENNKTDHISEKKLDSVVRDMNEHIQAVHRELSFTIDEESGKTIIKVIDIGSKEVIRQIPGEEALKVARQLKDGAELKLFSEYI